MLHTEARIGQQYVLRGADAVEDVQLEVGFVIQAFGKFCRRGRGREKVRGAAAAVRSNHLRPANER